MKDIFFSCVLLSNAIAKQYAVCNEDFDEIQNETCSLDKCYDTIAPCTQSVELEDEAEGSKDLHPDLNEQ